MHSSPVDPDMASIENPVLLRIRPIIPTFVRVTPNVGLLKNRVENQAAIQ